jgi:hypothetical protein
MVFFIGAASAGIESARTARRKSPRDGTRDAIETPFSTFFSLAQAPFPGLHATCPAPQSEASPKYAGREFDLTNFGRTRIKMDAKLRKECSTKEPLWPGLSIKSLGPTPESRHKIANTFPERYPELAIKVKQATGWTVISMDDTNLYFVMFPAFSLNRHLQTSSSVFLSRFL